ncbi:ShlB/FhaC/HecB family hemolysin secretion/activation protein [Acaryochloris sp. IP29b_bin.137]|uniref:ShlB/FhaC/HecB family hemolysin secretion/activation protein n=1 Tax=Acaryochloris sp. IP29b_bin.137 TaxID=2969217 RepID=UPI00260BAD0E|nr:ShlB/FhaC/HecB family hemolysin secretion/activation protein [Acaryochloris sp. IP29b_bin.137]
MTSFALYQFSFVAIVSMPVFAQSSPPSGVTLPLTTPEQIDQTLPSTTETHPDLPNDLKDAPDPSLKIPKNQEEHSPSSLKATTFFVQRVEVLGSTVLQADIDELIQPFENRSGVTFEQLIDLRTAITQTYIKNGYVTSGAFLPNAQDISDGIVQIQVVEGQLERIDVTGLKRLRNDYIRQRLQLASSPPLQQQRLEQALKLLQLNPLVQQIDAELTAGTTPGLSVLKVNVKQTPEFQAGVAIDNYRSPSVGSLQGSIDVAHNNVLGLGDLIQGSYDVAEGLEILDVWYTIPWNARNGTVGIRYSNSDSKIVTAEFRDLDIRSETQTLAFQLRQPIIQTPSQEFVLGLGFDLRQSQTFLLDDIPFSFSQGPEDGESKVRVLRFFQDWTLRDASSILSARSQFNIGLDIFDSTINLMGASGDFFSWLGQFQWVQRLPHQMVLVTRVSAQLTPDTLLPLEKFSIGGIDSIRGYVQNQRLADNGLLGSIELRIPLLRQHQTLQLTPFFEAGKVWNTSEHNLDDSTLASIGLGLRWQIFKQVNARLDFGLPLFPIDNLGSSLQESGLYFSLRYQPF